MVTPTDARFIEQGRAYLAAGLGELAEARDLLQRSDHERDAERIARQALIALRRAMNWLDDSPADLDEAHSALDAAGRWVRESFGCRLPRSGTSYSRTCPVDLAHVRVGFSPGMVIGGSECGICRKDYLECDHISGFEYDGEVCVRTITSIIDVTEVSLVSRPANPEARIEQISMPVANLRDLLGDGFTPGMDISCDRCLHDCGGLRSYHE